MSCHLIFHQKLLVIFWKQSSVQDSVNRSIKWVSPQFEKFTVAIVPSDDIDHINMLFERIEHLKTYQSLLDF